MISMEWHAETLTMALTGLQGAMSDLRPAWQDVHKIMRQYFAAIFKSEGSYPDGRGWAPLNPVYARWKRRQGVRKGILRFSDELMKSFTQESHQDHVYREGPDFVEIGSRRVYAKAHNYGYPPRNLPARTIIKRPSQAEGERIVDAILTHLLRGMRKGVK